MVSIEAIRERMEFRDYYKTLGVRRDASDEEIRKAFRGLARRFHPDVAKDKAEGERRFKEINEAYEVLGDPEKRRRYDAIGAQGMADGLGGTGFGGAAPPEGWDYQFSGTGFSDFFEQFFGPHARGGAGFGGPGGGAARSGRGRDIEADLLVTLEEVLRGAERTVTLRRRAGSGRPVTIRIPAGVREGQRLRVRGEGASGAGGGESGDLFLYVRFERHPFFQAHGADLLCTLDLAPWEAVLGASVTLPGLEGRVRLTVPPGTTEAEELVARGMGLPGAHGHRGDLRATVRIRVPAHATAEEQQAWERLRDLSRFHPRD